MTTQQTFNEMIDSLTGHEEQKIESAFGADIMSLLEASATKASRALIFITFVREGESGGDAKKRVMDLTIKQLGDHFADAEDEPMPEEPITEQGKDD